MKVLAVVSAYNEEELIGQTVSSVLSLEEVESVLVVDDASLDNTPKIAADNGARVVVNGRNLGKGRSLSRVLGNVEFDYLLLLDGDLGTSASEAKEILRPLIEGQADLSIAAFPTSKKKSGFGIAQGIARWGIKYLTGIEMSCPLSGQRALTRNALACVLPLERGFGVEVGMTVDAARSNLRILEVQTSMQHRKTGRNLQGFVHRGKQAKDIVIALARKYIRR